MPERFQKLCCDVNNTIWAAALTGYRIVLLVAVRSLEVSS